MTLSKSGRCWLELSYKIPSNMSTPPRHSTFLALRNIEVMQLKNRDKSVKYYNKCFNYYEILFEKTTTKNFAFNEYSF
jgi:hypothetical protein